MPIIRVVRHGETDYNREGKYLGRIDVPLNRIGREQAAVVAKAPELCNTNRIICSSLQRVRETAQIIAANLKIRVQIDDRLIERSLGVYEGLTKEQAAAKFPEIYQQNITRIFKAAPPAGETPREVCLRVKSALADIIDSQATSDVLIVTHGFVARVIHAYFNPNLSEAEFFEFHLRNSEIATYVTKG